LSASFYEAPRNRISQGDILENVPHLYLTGSDQKSSSSTIVRANGILLSHDCQIDKEQVVLRWAISPVTPLHKLPKGQQGDTMRNRILSRLFLPRYGSLTEDSFVDFDNISTIDRDIIRGATRILALSDEGRRGLYAQFIRFLTRWQLRALACPACGAELNATDSLPVRTD
jgi:hypothetical protein